MSSLIYYIGISLRYEPSSGHSWSSPTQIEVSFVNTNYNPCSSIIPNMADVWELHRSTIHRLYVLEDKSLADVMRHVKENHGFQRGYVPNA
jgi:hypothetical protein